MKKFALLFLLFAFLTAGFFFARSQQKTLPEIHGIYLDKPKMITPFVLTQTQGTPFSDQNLLGQWSLVFFGFTYCPDICPTTLALLNNVMDDIKQQAPNHPLPQVIFVSVDPQRDNLAQLDHYVHYFNPNFIAATGEVSQLTSFSRQLGVVFDRVNIDPKEPEQYLMEHSTSIALINPKGGIQAIFTSPHQIDSMAQEIILVQGVK